MEAAKFWELEIGDLVRGKRSATAEIVLANYGPKTGLLIGKVRLVDHAAGFDLVSKVHKIRIAEGDLVDLGLKKEPE